MEIITEARDLPYNYTLQEALSELERDPEVNSIRYTLQNSVPTFEDLIASCGGH